MSRRELSSTGVPVPKEATSSSGAFKDLYEELRKSSEAKIKEISAKRDDAEKKMKKAMDEKSELEKRCIKLDKDIAAYKDIDTKMTALVKELGELKKLDAKNSEENEKLKGKVEELIKENDELKKKAAATAECKKAGLSSAADLSGVMTRADILRLLFATPDEKEKFIEDAKEVARIKRENKAMNDSLSETADAAGFIDG